WPANRRILYNRASADPPGRPWDVSRALVYWDGHRWTGWDTPDFKVDEPPESGLSPCLMNPEGVGRVFARRAVVEGAVAVHYGPFETPVGSNPLFPDERRAVSNPAARVFKGDLETMGTVNDFPHVATACRLTEHFHFWTKHARLNAI